MDKGWLYEPSWPGLPKDAQVRSVSRLSHCRLDNLK